MPQIKDVLKQLVEKHGGNKAEIARKLSEKMNKTVSGQLIGQYEAGRQKPKSDFILAWKSIYGEDIQALAEGNVSIETKTNASVEPDEYRAWIGDLRLDLVHLRETNLRYLAIIEVLSSKVGVSN